MMDWTLAIAVGGLVIALISFGWNIFLHANSSPKVQVRAMLMKMDPTPPGIAEGEEILIVEAVNLRSRCVTIRGFYGEYCEAGEDGLSHFLLRGSCPELHGYASTLPCPLKEGEVATLMLKASDIDDLRNIQTFHATDTTGKDWYSVKLPLVKRVDKRSEHR